MLTHVKSAEAWLAAEGRLPVQLKFLIEGEEEVGSEQPGTLHQGEQADRLACDCVVISDTQPVRPRPAGDHLRPARHRLLSSCGCTGPKQDLHSGTFGGAVTNPANALCEMLSALIDEQGQVQVPGFYDDVAPLSLTRARTSLPTLPFDEAEFMRQIGVDAVAGEEGFATLERRWARPTFDINGLTSGYQGEGAKTVLPARADGQVQLSPGAQPGSRQRSRKR